jgi:hypothetical protein
LIGERAVQRRAGIGIDALVEVEAADFGAGVLGHWGDRVFHRLISSARLALMREVWRRRAAFCNALAGRDC